MKQVQKTLAAFVTTGGNLSFECFNLPIMTCVGGNIDNS